MKDSLRGLASLQAFLVPLPPTLARPEMHPNLGLKFCRHAPCEWWGRALIERYPIIGLVHISRLVVSQDYSPC
jgi:hypothetical protein